MATGERGHQRQPRRAKEPWRAKPPRRPKRRRRAPAGAAKAGRATEHNVGRVVQVIGPVLDVEFEAGTCRRSTTRSTCGPAAGLGRWLRRGGRHIVVEVQQEIGRKPGSARSRWSSTDGVERGMEVIDTGGPITVPVGNCGTGTDPQRHRRPGRWRPPDPGRRAQRWPIHRPAPLFVDLEPKTEGVS